MDPLPLFLAFLLLFPPLFFSRSFPFLLKHDFLLLSLSPSQQASPAVLACLLVPPPAVYATLLPSPAALSHTSPTAHVTPLTSLPGSSSSRCCSSSSSSLSCSHHCGFPNLQTAKPTMHRMTAFAFFSFSIHSQLPLPRPLLLFLLLLLLLLMEVLD